MKTIIAYSLLTISAAIIGTQSISPMTFDARNTVSHLVSFNDTYFVATTNYIYQLDASFKILQTLRLGPEDSQDNHVTLLVVSPDNDKPVILWCGSLHTASCHINLIHNLNGGNFLDKTHHADILRAHIDENDIDASDHQLNVLTYGFYGHLGSTAGTTATFIDISSNENLRDNFAEGNHILLASTMYDGRDHLDVPQLGFYTLAKTGHAQNYFIKPTFMDPFSYVYSWLSMYNAYIPNYPMHRVAMFELGDYIYMVTVQRMNVSTPLENIPFHTRIARVNKTDVLFQTYIEAPIECRMDDSNYNIAMDAVVGGATEDVMKGVSGEVLYLLQGKSSDATPFSGLSRSSAVCAISLAAIDASLDRAARRCHLGRGQLVEWYYGREKGCQRTTVTNVKTGKTENRALLLLMKAKTLTLSPLLSLPYNATMLYTEVQGQTTVAVVGTHQGAIHKINMANGAEYHTFSGSGGSPVSRDSVVAGGQLVVTTGSKVMSVPISSCGIYTNAVACTGRRDPIRCGWCGALSCTAETQCNSTDWSHYAPPPQIYSVSPANGSITGNTVVTLTGYHFALYDINSTISSVRLSTGACRVTSVQARRIICVSTAVSAAAIGPVTVVRSDMIGEANGSIATRGHSTALFAYLMPELHQLVPNYGPLMGGTILTIAGSNLLVGNSHVVKVGNEHCSVRSVTQNMLLCSTPTANFDPQATNITLCIDGTAQFHTSYMYKADPVISKVQKPFHSLFSGGIPVCIDGRNFNSIPQLSAVFSFPSLTKQELNSSLVQSCSIDSDSKLCCLTPNLAAVVTLNTVSTHGSIPSNMALDIGGKFEAVATVMYHHQPTVYGVSAIQLPNDIVQVNIEGQGFDHLSADLLKVTIASKVCLVNSINSSSISCWLHHQGVSAGDVLEQVTLEYGALSLTNMGPTVLKRALDSSALKQPTTSINMTMIGAVGIAIFGLLMFALIFAVMRQTRKKSTSLSGKEDSSTYIGVQEPITDNRTRQLMDLYAVVRERGVLIDLCRLRVGGVIGSGCFGKVHKGALYDTSYEQGATYQSVAIKTIKGCQSGQEEVRKFIDEALLMQTFKHKHVLTMIGISFGCDGQPRVVLPFMANGDLKSYLRDTSNRVTLDDMLGFANDIALGMDYLEHVLCVHRDLAARNCMLDADLRVKVADFGLSRDLDTFENNLYQSRDRNAKLPVKWMSPESIVDRCFSSKSDVWSFGVTLWEIFSRGAHPYPEIDNYRILEHVQAGGRLRKPLACPQQIYDCMQSTWDIEADDRPTFTMIVNELQLFIANRDSSTSPLNEDEVGEM